MNFLTVSVTLSFIACLIFTIVVIVLSCMGYTIPEVLIQYFFMTFGVEFASAAAIKIGKYTINKQKIKDKVDMLIENNLPVEHDDISDSSDSSDDYYDDGTVYG